MARLHSGLADRSPARNPLRRRVDRLEVALMIALVTVFLIGAPFAAMVTSDLAGRGAAATARLEQATWHPVAAVVQRGVPQALDPYGGYVTQVPVRWTLDGVAHTGTVKAPAGTPAGTTVTIWTGPAGEQAGPPLAASQVARQATLAGVLAVTVLAVTVIVSALVIRRILDRSRMAAWDAEWSATGPQWWNCR